MTDSFYPLNGEPVSTPIFVKKTCFKSLLIHLFVKTLKRLDGMELKKVDFDRSKSHVLKFKKAMKMEQDDPELQELDELQNQESEGKNDKDSLEFQLEIHPLQSYEWKEFQGFIRIPNLLN